MVRLRHVDSVRIQLSGPSKIIPHTKVEIGRRNLWNTCKLTYSLNYNYYLGSGYCIIVVEYNTSIYCFFIM